MRMPSNATENELDMEKYATNICKIPLHEAGLLFDSGSGSEQELHNKMMDYRVGPNVESLQADKPSNIEDPNEIVDMRGFRPFEGFGLPGDGSVVTSKRDSTTDHHANTSSNGIDIMLVVLRQHLSFHLDLCIPQDKITDEESEVYKVAWMNLGENDIQDWDIKRKLLKSVHGIPDLQFDDIMEKKFSFEDVFTHPKLQNLFRGAHFDIASHIMLRKYSDQPDSVFTRAIAEPDSLRLFNELRWDGVKELDVFIDRHFKTVGEVIPLGEPKEFVAKAEYKKLGNRWSIKDGGRYMLFYVRITPRPTPLPEDYFDEDAPEFEPRCYWDTSDVDMTDTNYQNRSALKKDSTGSAQSSSNNRKLEFRSELSKFGPSTDSRVPMLGPTPPNANFRASIGFRTTSAWVDFSNT
ncbi:hypothetical protein BHYA_0158g00230 [Botrytis hyacinthi]|uniref:Uncharacterized protein n=1 Tax=Botrytis hyacinthi TaxID=278943 RepID=A0A4Z1GLS2_9HELO|nr:hypothetical protein BHYA_0158g00230 [Botrytis hyacinthi]